MANKISGKYLGKKRIELTHGPTGSKIITDAPLDNQGEGTTFSPTDLTAASLGACMLTVISIVAERDQLNITGMHMEVEKHMATEPRRIVKLPVTIHLPASLSPADRQKLENAARTCPVNYSINSEIESPLTFIYDL